MNKFMALMISMFLLVGAPVLAADKRTNIPIGNSPTLGPENAPVTIIEFIDFQ
jgi:protein-disulfide isomerase